MPGRLELAAEESKRLLNDLTPSIDDFLCRALRGDNAAWTVMSGVHPDLVLERCRHHGISALLFDRMHRSEEWESWPVPLRGSLEDDSKSGVALELLSTHCLDALLRQFDKAGIRCLLMKGEALSRTHYDTPGSRERCDSDLFIHLADIKAVQEAAADAGFRITPPIYKTHQFALSRPGDRNQRVQIDVHWRILNHPRYARSISFEQAYARSREVSGLQKTRMLDSVDALLVACMHREGSDRHDADRLIWIHDIHALVAGMSEESMRVFAERAAQLDVQAECLAGLSRASACFLTEVPVAVRARLESTSIRGAGSSSLARSYLGLVLDDLKHLPDSEARFGLFRELFMPSAPYLLQKYHKSSRLWLPLLYLRRMLGGTLERFFLR